MSWGFLKSWTVVMKWNWMNVRKSVWTQATWTSLQRRKTKIDEGNRITTLEMQKLW